MLQKKPKKNEIMFIWFNYYSGIILKTPTKTLVIDPVTVKAKDLKNVDVILITHEHYDHLDQGLVNEIWKKNNCSIIADQTSTKKLCTIIDPKNIICTSPGMKEVIGDVLIKTEKCNHPQAATPVSYIITSEDGIKIFHTADSLPFPEMVSLGKREKIDLAFCTIGITPETSPTTGFEIARLIKPKIAVPYHNNSMQDINKFSEIVKREIPKTTCLTPEIGKIYKVSKKKIENGKI